MGDSSGLQTTIISCFSNWWMRYTPRSSMPWEPFEAVVPAFDIPYHTEIMERFDGIDMDAAGRVSGPGFYYLLGDIARLHEAVGVSGDLRLQGLGLLKQRLVPGLFGLAHERAHLLGLPKPMSVSAITSAAS